jgi:hypothetical protein
MKPFKAEFALYDALPNPKPDDSKQIDMVSWGDYMWWDLNAIRDGIIDLYGEDSVTHVVEGIDRVCFFQYDETVVDFEAVGKHIGVKHSTSSSSSSKQNTRPFYEGIR